MPRGIYIRTKIPLRIRFDAKWKRVDSGCWEWQAARDKNGYGIFGDAAFTTKFAHRISWILHRGEIPAGMGILHSCDNPRCVNPEHLFVGTQSDNMKDMGLKGRARSTRHPESLLRGEEHPMAKLFGHQVLSIRLCLARGVTVSETARNFNVDRKNIRSIRDGIIWKHI